MNILHNQNDCLYECKRIVRECVSSSSLNINCDDILNCIHEEIDTDKFNSWLSYNLNTFKSKTNQHSYFKKSFLIELEKGTFKKVIVNYIPNTQPFINALREHGCCVLADDSAYLFIVWDRLLNKYKVPSNIAEDLNNKILNYLDVNSNFEDYKTLLIKSKTLAPYKVDWDEIDKDAKAYIAEWDKMLDDLESEE